MPDILIRDLPDPVVANIDAKAQRLGLSRNEYLRRELTKVGWRTTRVTVDDLRRMARVLADLDDPEIMARAWDSGGRDDVADDLAG